MKLSLNISPLLLFSKLLFWGISPALSQEPGCPGSVNPNSSYIFCDDFESSEPLADRYFEYNDHGGTYLRLAGVGINNSSGMRTLWQSKEMEAGNLKYAFGRVPAGIGVKAHTHLETDFREIYWRHYLKMKAPWSGYPHKLSRATIFASKTSWAQAMIAHIWSGSDSPVLNIDPATGIDSANQLVTTTYNDFANQRWLGAVAGSTPIFSEENAGRWFCIETHVKLNTPGGKDGIFRFWVDNQLQAERLDLNWVGSWSDYGLNTIMFENYWNGGAPGIRERFLDNIVISTSRIGCTPSSNPAPPQNLLGNIGH